MTRLLPRRPQRRRGLLWLLSGLLLIGGLYTVFRVQLSVPPARALAAGHDLLTMRRVLAVVAHPDDLEWYLGGTLRRLTEQGARVVVIVATDGEKGPNRTGATDLAATRRAEQAAAGRVLGYTRIYSLGLPDRGASQGPRLLAEVQRIYAQEQPQAVFVFDPALPALPYLHPDHQGSARIVLDFWKNLGAGRPPVYLFQTRRPDVAVDISSVIDLKARALAQHVTQNGGSAGMMPRLFAGDGRQVGVSYAELFRQLR
ncbi:PIG-L family deacetylase [Deinococcus sp. KNUC1210]|uniref:PIG-L deacetylase family protein n=1 Tax=Deinococcus sp. KNUC1210 TaxID=2917691 RepID=UPI001EF00B9D|nr:PIG-L deacetylase family protein [Deinococcus sp. KNUC1210]ULH14346.1 PIG-L family deacetylase [Deinococcus sp. KNUC1210]